MSMTAKERHLAAVLDEEQWFAEKVRLARELSELHKQFIEASDKHTAAVEALNEAREALEEAKL